MGADFPMRGCEYASLFNPAPTAPSGAVYACPVPTEPQLVPSEPHLVPSKPLVVQSELHLVSSAPSGWNFLKAYSRGGSPHGKD